MKIKKAICINDLLKNNKLSQKDLLNKFILVSYVEKKEIHTILYVFSLKHTFEFKTFTKKEYYCYSNIIDVLNSIIYIGYNVYVI